jgi:hypothetical protein
MESKLGGSLFLAAMVLSLSRYYSLPKPKPKPARKIYGDILPPLPPAVVTVLEASRLCFLATNDEQEPHLSLMNFTYVQTAERIILCTRRSTKKFKQLMENPKVSFHYKG